jgi:hypothetical protein
MADCSRIWRADNRRPLAQVLRDKRMIPKSGHRFPACAKPLDDAYFHSGASAGEGRSDKIMRKTLLPEPVA